MQKQKKENDLYKISRLNEMYQDFTKNPFSTIDTNSDYLRLYSSLGLESWFDQISPVAEYFTFPPEFLDFLSEFTIVDLEDPKDVTAISIPHHLSAQGDFPDQQQSTAMPFPPYGIQELGVNETIWDLFVEAGISRSIFLAYSDITMNFRIPAKKDSLISRINSHGGLQPDRFLKFVDEGFGEVHAVYKPKC